MLRMLACHCLIAAALCGAGGAASDEGTDPPDADAVHQLDSHAAGHTATHHDTTAGSHGDHHGVHHKNIAGVFVGVTHAGRRMNGGALGLEYERRVSQHFGIGATVEYTDKADLWVVAIPFAYHSDRWKFLIAPGIEDGHHGKEELVRFGAEYAFALSDDWEIAPKLSVDLVDGEDVWVFGVFFGRGF